MMLSEIAPELYNHGVFKLGSFRLKSGDVSPFYLDLRLIPSVPSLFRKVTTMYSRLIKDIGYSPAALAGIMSAGVPFATAVCLEDNIPLIQIRSEAKSHGTKKLVEGIFPVGGKIILVDDLISTGASKLIPLRAVRELGGSCEDLVVLIDRTSGEEVHDLLLENGLKLHAAGNLEDLFTGLLQSNDIPEDQVSSIESAFEQWKSS